MSFEIISRGDGKPIAQSTLDELSALDGQHRGSGFRSTGAGNMILFRDYSSKLLGKVEWRVYQDVCHMMYFKSRPTHEHEVWKHFEEYLEAGPKPKELRIHVPIVDADDLGMGALNFFMCDVGGFSIIKIRCSGSTILSCELEKQL